MFCGAFAIGVAIFVPMFDATRGILAGFDAAAALFLAAVVPLFGSKAGDMRAHARKNDANRALLLSISVLVTLVILVSVASEMPGMKDPVTVLLVVVTLVLAWLFSNTVWALHYANLYYSGDGAGGDHGGLSFPECGEPNYWDFAYFSFTLGMTFQTSDVAITKTAMRRPVMVQSLAAFVFNIGVLAFSINVLGGG